MTEAEPVTYPSGIPIPQQKLGVNAEVVIITGMSGAGRTQAASTFADLGWYVVDNLPPQMLADLVSMIGEDDRKRIGAVVDVRGGKLFSDLTAVIDDLRSRGVTVTVLFLDASDATLVQRFEGARRPHPLQADGTLLEGIARERELVAAVRKYAQHVIDTSTLNVHQLREKILLEVAAEVPPLRINLQSFGFKNGIPGDADFVADVRFIDNPHWHPELRPLTGLDEAVRDHVLADEGAEEFLLTYTQLLDNALKRYRAQNKGTIMVGIGCTGGKHRSVAISEELGRRLRQKGYEVRVTHRDRSQG